MSQIIKNLASGPVPPSVATSYLLDDGNSAVASANVIQVHGVGASTSIGASNEIVVTVINEGFTWNEETTSFAAAVQNGYFCNDALTATLPATAGLVIGNTIIIYVDTTGVVVIQANTGQSIQVGEGVSSPGGTATCTAGQKGSILEIIFKPSDSTWHVQSSLGSWVTA
jgi:hypothetical protein